MTTTAPDDADGSLLSRVDAISDLLVAEMRESVGLHRYDGVVQDLSPAAVAAAVSRVGRGALPEDPFDAAALRTFEDAVRWLFAERQEHRRNPLLHIWNLDLSGYDREYAPAGERAASRARHLAGWPDAIAATIAALDLVPAPVAEALLSGAKGLAVGLDPDRDPAGGPVLRAALEAHAKLVAHLEQLAHEGDTETSVGPAVLARELGVWDGLEIDLTQLSARADAERDRLNDLLRRACAELDPDASVPELVARLAADHPDIGGVIAAAQAQTDEVLAFTREHRLAPWTDGECLVGPAPPSRRWAMAMMAWAAPEEPDAPSWYHVTPPEPGWPAEDIEDWLAVFSRTSLPAVTVHEVAPGHYAHSRSLRRAAGPVRRRLLSPSFAEGWAHYAEEMVVEVGFRAGDPRYVIGMCLEGLVRVTRLACSIALHTGLVDVDGAAEKFSQEAFLKGSAGRSEAQRGTFDIGYGRYTLGKLMILDVREEARKAWGDGFSLPRFHAALLDLGSPPLGLMQTAVERG